MTYGEMYRRGEQELLEAGIEEAGLEARLLLEHDVNYKRSNNDVEMLYINAKAAAKRQSDTGEEKETKTGGN